MDEVPKIEEGENTPEPNDGYELNKIKIKKSDEQTRLAKRARNRKSECGLILCR